MLQGMQSHVNALKNVVNVPSYESQAKAQWQL